MILGAIKVLREATRDERESAGAIANQYAHVTAVRLIQSENAADVKADFALGDIIPDLVNYRASIIAHIRNTQPMIVKNASASAAIYPKGDEAPIFESTNETLEFAPNSVFPLSFIDREGYGIDAGDYTAIVAINHEGRDWLFEKDFTILPQIAAEVNNGSVNQHGQQRPDTAQRDTTELPFWALIVGGLGTVLPITTIILMVVTARRRSAFARKIQPGKRYAFRQLHR